MIAKIVDYGNTYRYFFGILKITPISLVKKYLKSSENGIRKYFF
jgi:hypothetical protein